MLIFTRYSKKKDKEINDYNVYGVTIAEAEVDILTGEKQVRKYI
jgi:CO/xanthine dehydrogenase Mo-binding subunit